MRKRGYNGTAAGTPAAIRFRNGSHAGWRKIRHRIRMNWQIYIMLIPVAVFYIVFSYVPMSGIVLAWKNYRRSLGIFGSPWVGWEHFLEFFSHPANSRVIQNTLVVSALKLFFCFPAPILLAILLNEVVHKNYKKSVQTLVYLPNFISWVILGGIVKMMLSTDDGVINNIVAALGGSRQAFLLKTSAFYPTLIITEIIKSTGWGTIIYIAAISGIDANLYEAARIDGCKRFGCIAHITLPSILPIIVILLLLAIGNIMNAGFDPIYNLYNPTTYEVADIIDTLVYRLGIQNGRLELATAIGLFKSVINFVLLIGASMASKRITGYSMYSLNN
jgi:putative aldouronate transport system permease protein